MYKCVNWRTLLLTAFLLGMFLYGVSWGQIVYADSLWSDATGSLFTDQRGVTVGDLITVIIVEETQARSTAQTTTGKSGEVGIGPGRGLLDFIPLMGVDGGDSMTASGTTTRGGSITAKLTAKVTEVFPNGNLAIEGRQKITVNGEEQEVLLTGVIRAADISADNTILSTYVADASITYKGQGALGAKQKPGILSRIFNWIF